MSTTMSASSTLTAPPARGAAQALVDGLQALVPTIRPSEVHRHVHRAATVLQAALVEGARIPRRSSTRWSP